MGEYLRFLIPHFLSEKCYSEFLVKFNFLNTECIKQTISKGLGTGIILGSALVKLPQIVKILNAKSAAGLSFLGVLLELVAVTSSASYSYARGYPFSSWGESLFLMLETAAIAFLVLFYGTGKGRANVFAALYSLITYLLFTGLVPLNTLWSMQVANLPVVVVAKSIQALENYRNGHTGQLSASTVNLLFLGSMARIFTSIQETGDQVIILTFLTASLFNGLIAAQILYYRKATAKFVLEAKKKKK